jgi:hypothetical protein
MGAEVFETIAHGSTAKEAFDLAVEEAKYENGHSGYTGTIAEKNSFTMYDGPDDLSAFDISKKMLDEDDESIADKWGPAGCVKMAEGRYLFFGWASS